MASQSIIRTKNNYCFLQYKRESRCSYDVSDGESPRNLRQNQAYHFPSEGKRSPAFTPCFPTSLFRCAVRPSCPCECRYDDSFSDYVELNNDEKLDDDDTKLLALVSKQDKQVWKN